MRLNGIRSLVFSYGLGRSEFIEFSYAKSLIVLERPGMVLDVGSGHSLVPFLVGRETIVVDVDDESLRWQMAKSRKVSKTVNAPIKASAEKLPFRDAVFDLVTAISSLEHMPGDGDVAASLEIFRTLKEGGLSIVTVPGSRLGPTVTREGMMVGIPRWAGVLLGPILRQLFGTFQVDRSGAFLERRYSRRGVLNRLVPPDSRRVSICGYAMAEPFRTLVAKVYPYSSMTEVDAFLATRVKLVEGEGIGGLILISYRK
jgi:SAM-dependent methyltransferase